jgi:5-methylcytosine-specific restriction endonuclease McrBC GTP-binding regulatory subunit McrB
LAGEEKEERESGERVRVTRFKQGVNGQNFRDVDAQHHKLQGVNPMPKQNLTRYKSMNFRVTPEEYDMIKKVQALTGIKSTRAYLLKQTINGHVIHIELDSVKELNRLLGLFGNNVNQIARPPGERNRECLRR